jgi:hypothetical protein
VPLTLLSFAQLAKRKVWAVVNPQLTQAQALQHTVWNISTIFDPALLDLEVAIAKNVIYFPRNE